MAAVSRPPAKDVGVLAAAVFAVSTSAPLIAATAAPALAIAFWRNAFAVVFLLPVALWRAQVELRAMTGRQWRLCVLAGMFLACHFGTWVPSVRLTSVASATALVATQPVWAAVIARLRGQGVSRQIWLGIGVAVVGAAVLTGADVTLSARALLGDALAIIGGVLAACYVTAGAAARADVSTTVYITVCYGTSAVGLFGCCLVGGQPLAGYPADAWLKIAALTLLAQLLGHSLVNAVLRSTGPTVVSMAILFEVPGASLIAAGWLHELPAATALPGLLLLLAGVGLVIRAGARSVPVD